MAKKAKSVLIQAFVSASDQGWAAAINEAVEGDLPGAVFVGASTSGEIMKGGLQTGTTALSAMFFEATALKTFAMPCLPGSEYNTGRYLGKAVREAGPDIAGILLFTTPLSIDAAELLAGMSAGGNEFPVFGGGAGEYESGCGSMVFCGKDQFSQGVVAVALTGSDVQIDAHMYLGWQPISKEMSVTDADGVLLKTVDNVPALQVYERYLEIKNDRDFFPNVLKFPLVLERNGHTYAHVPVLAYPDGALRLSHAVKTGEKFRLGYGNPELIIRNAAVLHKKMAEFGPEAILLFSCACRRHLLQDDVDLETKPFQAIAPTVGFYAQGEVFGTGESVQTMNSTILAVGIREGEKAERRSFGRTDWKPPENDHCASSHSQIISQLVHFIKIVTTELEQANRELTRLAETDKLTQIYNRLKLDEILQREINICRRYHTDLSIILLDLDHFKQVNDKYGHIAGDNVLVHLADTLKKNTRINDAIGRWGGEEFLVILPHTNIEEACKAAEKLRVVVEKEVFPVIGHQTCSFGVTNYFSGDNNDKLLLRADMALYKAKKSGRNRVMRYSLDLNVFSE